jgi:hypothetical protein
MWWVKMAHFYDCVTTSEKTDVEGNGLKVLDSVSRSAVVRFWLSVVAVIAASAVFYFLSRNVLMPALSLSVALAAAGVGVFSLYVLDRSVRRIHLVSPEEAKADRRVVYALQQLDDRFAVFNGVRENDIWIDHLIVGPSGVYMVKTSMLREAREHPDAGDLAQAKEACQAVQKLFQSLLATSKLQVEPVLCVVGKNRPMVRQENHGVWLVTLDRMVSALLRRSGQEGSISKDVNVTGAFTTDLTQVHAVEQALAGHWNLPKRPVFLDYLPPNNPLASKN